MFVGSYLWQLRQKIGHDLVLMPGAQVLVSRPDGRVLFQRRTDNGVWELPAGSCEPDQSFADCAAAELVEETGLSLPAESFTAFGSISGPRLHRLSYPNGDQVQAYAICFSVELPGDARLVAEAAEVSGFAWADPAEPPRPLHPPTAEALSMHAEYLRTGRFIAH